MAEQLKTWGDVLAAVRRAIDEGDREQGEELVELMQREASLSGDLGQESSALFYEGMFADAFGQLARAEACFIEAAAIDERLHGAEHDAVADALNSVAIVQERADKLEEAAATRARAAEIYVATRSLHRCSALVRAGQAQLKLGRYEEAEALLERSLEHPPTRDAAWDKIAGSLLHATFAPRKLFTRSLEALARASRTPLEDSPRHREAQARLWCDLGHVSVVFGMSAQSAAAYECALELGQGQALREEARRGLEHLEERFGLPLDTFRVVHLDPERGRAHVAHLERGLFVVLDPPPDLELGAEVEIDATRSPTALIG